MSVHINNIYRLLFKIWRERRFDQFMSTIQPAMGDVLLDVGGYPGFWIAHPPIVKRIDTLNLHSVSWDGLAAPRHNITPLVGDGCDLAFPDKSYDIVFSNSVIEHVGSWDRQQRFAAEVRRVGKAIWVQTPAYECPFEPHFLAPLVHYLPLRLRKHVVRWGTPWGWIERPRRDQIDGMVDSIRLLRKQEMASLFPDCEILTETMFGMVPKSYIAVRRIR